MSKNNDTLKHALHNEEACNHVELAGKYDDWVITMSFYAALQFVSFKIFPLKIKVAPKGSVTIIGNIREYQNFKRTKLSRHKLLTDLVKEHCNSISIEYEWLMNLSMTARYLNYQQDKEIARKAISLMRKIKEYTVR